MNLYNLHKVMKGDMTIDQACEGMTDDFEIGHVSHRKDGDYKKVAQGKWVPVKAAGQGQMGAKAQSTEKLARSLHSLNQQMGLSGKATGEEAESIREELTERDRQAPAAKTEDILKTSTAQTIKRSRNGVTDDDVVKFFNEEIKGRGNGTGAHALRIFGNTSQMMTQFDQWYKREKSRKAGQMSGGEKKNSPTGLARDTKIRLSQIKREQTQDKTYNVGETSQRKDGLYKKVAPGKWVPVKGGGTPQETVGTLAARGYAKEINSKTNNIEKRDKLLTKKFTELFGTKGPSSFEAMGELYSRVKKAKPHTDEWYIAMNNYDMASKIYHDVIGSDNVDYQSKYRRQNLIK